MNSFSISDLQSFSGVKAHTIRIWEQRYNALKPIRSKGNIRLYDHLQLRRLLNIVSLMESDHKVSKLCRLSDKELNNLLETQYKESPTADAFFDVFITQLIASSLTYDEATFDKIFSNCILRFGLKQTYLNVLYPMVVRVGLMWAKDSLPTSQEHFITNLIRQKLSSAIDSLPPPKATASSWVLFLPENEFHEMGLLFAHYLLRYSGQKVIYLGANVPFDSVKLVLDHTDSMNILFFLVHQEELEFTQTYIRNLENSFKKQRIFLSGNPIHISQLKLGKATQWIESADALELAITPSKENRHV